jgi:hypothetical protein
MRKTALLPVLERIVPLPRSLKIDFVTVTGFDKGLRFLVN